MFILDLYPLLWKYGSYEGCSNHSLQLRKPPRQKATMVKAGRRLTTRYGVI